VAEEEVAKLYQNGVKIRDISKRCNLSIAEVYYILGKRGLPLRRLSGARRRVGITDPMVTFITGPRKLGRMLLPIPTEVKEKLSLQYRDAIKWSITPEGVLLKKLS
jgi:hypothetical protein